MNNETISLAVCELTEYAIGRGLIAEEDRVFAHNAVCERIGLSDFSPVPVTSVRPLCEILGDLVDAAAGAGKCDADSIVSRDLFDTALMGIFTPRPSEVIARFYALSEEAGGRAATDWFYKLSCDVNYIRTDRIARDKKWKVASPYGEMDITVNLSKPEKDPRAIAAAKLLPQSGYPMCLLCHECEGYAGSLSKPARQNLRQIPFDMAGQKWFLQYSPYVYYNEHCIALSADHVPMKIDRSSFEKALGFVKVFPHYFIGQNADLPIVGGSILSHDHMQGGRYVFAMERAPIERPLVFSGYEEIRAGIVRWPMSVIRLRGADTHRLCDLAEKILGVWRTYTDARAQVYAETEGERHNTITPIARRRGEDYELDLVLRNNLTTPEHPLGLYHPHEQWHNIKKENIGLIEVMGLAVLPARLKGEMERMKAAILAGEDFAEVEELKKHAAWFAAFRDKYAFTEENVEGILEEEVGQTFVHVLEDAGVYFGKPEAFLRFIAAVNGD